MSTTFVFLFYGNAVGLIILFYSVTFHIYILYLVTNLFLLTIFNRLFKTSPLYPNCEVKNCNRTATNLYVLLQHCFKTDSFLI